MEEFLKKIKNLSKSQLMLLAAQQYTKMNKKNEGITHEPIAVVGIGCRYPNKVVDQKSFWAMLRDGSCGINEMKDQRWDMDAFFDPDPDVPGKTYSRWAGLIENMGEFDANFFGLSPRETHLLDPQQRLLLEVVWEALENAGIPAPSLIGTNGGVFIGIGNNDYARLINYRLPIEQLNGYAGTGNSFSVSVGRLSYLLGLKGPSMALDTACSSSLVAIHQACQSLRIGETDMALAGGVNLILEIGPTITFSKARMLSREGLCKTFDESADGYVRAEGCGIVILKRLTDAQKNGDRILALIKGTAVNQDGRSQGITAPNGPSQESVIRAAHKCAGVTTQDISYVEAHGTATKLGDSIEMQALKKVFFENKKRESPLYVGSIKTNIGHTETASGVAGLIKVILSLQNEEIPPHIHFKTLNPYIKIDPKQIKIPTGKIPWPKTDKPRIAGVSSFGFSGMDADN